MDQATGQSNERSRTGGRAARRFSEVVSNGPTSIPDKEDVTAALSSVLPPDESSWQAQEPMRQQPQEAQRRHARAMDGERRAASANAPNGATPAAGTRPSSNSGNISNTGGDDDDGSGGGGLIDWALWPLWGTIDALKWAGGTVTEVAVAPVVRLASPWGLAGSMLTKAKAFTPQRARDLARVAGNGIVNTIGLVRTPAGGALLQASGRATGSLSMAVSTPAGRQLLVDSATGFVKIAEALDTPEAKNAIRQGAVVVARGMDALASRHSKIFVKDLADVMVQMIELATSQEATVMAAELTANIAHALEMEHMAGLERVAAEASAASCVDPNPTPGRNDTDDGGAHAQGVRGGGSTAGDAGEQVATLEDLVRVARLERARHEGGDAGESETAGPAGGRSSGGGSQSELGDVIQSSFGGSDGNIEDVEHSGTAQKYMDRGGVGTGVTAGELLRRGTRINLTPIRQEDLTGSNPLKSLTPTVTPTPPAPIAGRGAASRRPTVTRAPTSDAGAGAPHSAPSSPTGRRSPPLAAAAEASFLGGSSAADRPSRRRANTLSDISGGVSGRRGGREETAPSTTIVETPISSSGWGDGGGASDGASELPAVEYVRDGQAMLPRFTGETFMSLLRGKPLGLELQLEAPNHSTLDNSLARAARPSLEGWFPRSRKAVSGSNSVTRDPGPEARDDTVSGSGEGTATFEASSSSPAPKPASSWTQLVFALLLLLFAADGMRHRWHKMFGGNDKATKRSSTPSARSTTTAGPAPIGLDSHTGVGFGIEIGGIENGGGGGDGGPEQRFRATFLPPTCQDPVSGTSMAVWATPSGPCLSPAQDLVSNRGRSGSWFGGGGGGGGPMCAAAFRFCSAGEIFPAQGHDTSASPTGGNAKRKGGDKDATSPDDTGRSKMGEL